MPMTTYVLVHGAFHGGWCWRRVADRLVAAGHRVYAPTLTGLGERAHLLAASVDLETHIRDVTGVLESEELTDVVLVGHSYGGIPIAGAADRMRERIGRLVFLDAVVLADGETWSSIHPPEVVARFIDGARARHGGLAIPVPDAATFGITDEQDRQWVARRLTPHPLGTYRQPLRLRRPVGEEIDKTYIACSANPLASLSATRAALRRARGWTVSELAAGHDAMITAPAELTRLLLRGFARESGAVRKRGGEAHG